MFELVYVMLLSDMFSALCLFFFSYLKNKQKNVDVKNMTLFE